MRRVLIVLAILLPLMLVGCVSMGLPKVSSRGIYDPARPLIGPQAVSLETWNGARAGLVQAFEREVYGAYPDATQTEMLDHVVVETGAFEGRGDIEEYRLAMAGRETYLVTVTPTEADGPVPTIILQMFCGNRAALGGRADITSSPNDPGCDPDSWFAGAIRMVFGRHIMEPPIAEILDRGYALAIIYPGDIVPDRSSSGLVALESMLPDTPSGAITVWAWVYSRVIDVLDADPRYDRERTAVWGHSRNGKSALLAAVYDPRVDLVIAHQAGTGGTTLSRSHAGESIAQITDSYPHWFSPAYAGFAGNEEALSVDQHQLIALAAPRPVLIGGAWRDQWSDPQGSFRAARSANPVYALYGSEGLRQADMSAYDPTADLALFMRGGLHGVQPSDWDNFLAFLDAHFQP